MEDVKQKILGKDIYLYICRMADEITSLKMLSVNKYFYSELCFRIVLENKYPLLCVYRLNENWIRFYKRKIYIIQLRKIGYIYTASHDVDPEDQYLISYKEKDFSLISYDERKEKEKKFPFRRIDFYISKQSH